MSKSLHAIKKKKKEWLQSVNLYFIILPRIVANSLPYLHHGCSTTISDLSHDPRY